MLLRKSRLLLVTFLSVLLCASPVLLVKAEASMWVQNYGRSDWDAAYSLVETSDGGYALAGYGQADTSLLVKTDASGNIEWNKIYGGRFRVLVETSDGGYALTGFADPFGDGVMDAWLVKTDEFGDVEWNQTYGDELTDDYAFALVETSDGGYAVAGTRDFKDNLVLTLGWEVGVHGAFWLVKVNELGDVEWNQTYGYGLGCIEEAYSLEATSDGGYALTGYTLNYSAGTRDFWLVKTDENGVAPVAPEAAWVILPLLLAATIAIIICKKKLLHQCSKER